MPKLADTAQICMDLYYQNYKSDEDFFILQHFIYLCGVGYAKLLETEYLEARREAMRQTAGDPNMIVEIQLQSDWLQIAEVEIKDSKIFKSQYEGDLPARPISFPYDAYSFGVQSIRSLEGGEGIDYIRDTEKSSWMDSQLPNHDKSFWRIVGKKIVLKSLPCLVSKIMVFYIPDVSDTAWGKDGGEIPGSKEYPVIQAVLDMMFKARQGTVVDFSNNGNPNKVLQTEIDTAFSNIRTKPI